MCEKTKWQSWEDSSGRVYIRMPTNEEIITHYYSSVYGVNVTGVKTVPLNGVLRIILISISSFFTFGYFRLYKSLMHGYPSLFFSEEEQKKSGWEIRPHFRAHLVPGILYITVSTLLLVIALYI